VHYIALFLFARTAIALHQPETSSQTHNICNYAGKAISCQRRLGLSKGDVGKSMNMTVPAAVDPVALMQGIFQRARQQQLSLSELLQTVEKLISAEATALALDLYKTWIAFNDKNPLVHVASFNYAVLLNQASDTSGAIQALRATIGFNPDFAPAHINLGRVYEDCHLIGRAVQQWRHFAATSDEITPERLSYRLMALKHMGRVLEGAGLLEEAESALWLAMELDPTKHDAPQHWLALRQQQCKWPIFPTSEYITHRHLTDAMSPMTIACYADDPLFQLGKAYRYGKKLVGRPDLTSFPRNQVRNKLKDGKRIRVAYLSSDLREHAVGFALCEVLELHDKSNIEVYAYYCGIPRDKDTTHKRIRAAVDSWCDINGMTDAEAAAKIIEDEIDILIDVNGYTKMARAGVFAYRPAPVIVNFCGYPGTLASPFHQYIITDNYIVPPEQELYYTEKVLRIPCEQPVDRKREIAAKPTRADYGLPEEAFIYACFNGMQKITQACFSRWMLILKETPGSILWLLGDKEAVHARLRNIALECGVDPARLYFANKVPNPTHLARIALADLFLDTYPYGAHSTAADAITMGLPVLTVPGKGFASRFCASIVASAGIPELICDSPDDYVVKAIIFGRNRQALEPIKASLAAQRETCALRDMPRLARRLEELFREMQEAAELGQLPVPNLQNLDIYFEVGAELLQTPIEFETDEAYRKRYMDKLIRRNASEPLPLDDRLWTGS
jgi:predicted O-linked N-acetylglucosamine transferase (SPINDLY family)